MSEKLKQVFENIKTMSLKERAVLAHFLISSLDQVSDEAVDDDWANLAEKRFDEILSGAVKPVSWQQIKREVKSY